MRIQVEFLNGSSWWRDYVSKNVRIAEDILSSPVFLNDIRLLKKFDFCDETPMQVADKIAKTGKVAVKLGFYTGWWWSKAIAYEENGAVYFNTRKYSYGAGRFDNIIHEIMHVLGYHHNGNSQWGNQDTAPYLVGNMAYHHWENTRSMALVDVDASRADKIAYFLKKEGPKSLAIS